MSERKLPAWVAAACLSALALPTARAQQTPTENAPAGRPAAEARLQAEGEALADVARRVAHADRLAETGRYGEALNEYRYALSMLKKAGRGDGDLRARVRRLSQSLAVVRFDLADVPDGSYLEIAVDGRVVPPGAMRNGWFVRSGTMTITARRPGCGSWESEQTVKPGATETVKVPALTCSSGEVADMAGWQDEKFARAVQADGPPSARAAAPWLFRPDSGKRVGSRKGLLVWGGILATGGVAMRIWGDPETLSYGILGPTMVVTGVACLGVYVITSLTGSGGEGVAVAPIVDPEAGTGVALGWSGQW